MKNLTPSVSTHKPAIPLLVLIATLAYIPGCARHELVTPDDDAAIEVYESDTSNAFFWGLYISPKVMSADCEGSGFNDVVITRNYLQDLASVITLGIWMPASVEYRCRATTDPGGVFPKAPAQPDTQS